MDRYRSITFYDQGRALPKDINFEHMPCFFYRQSRRKKSVPFDIFRFQVDVVVYTGREILYIQVQDIMNENSNDYVKQIVVTYLRQVTFQAGSAFHVFETKLTDVDTWFFN